MKIRKIIIIIVLIALIIIGVVIFMGKKRNTETISVDTGVVEDPLMKPVGPQVRDGRIKLLLKNEADKEVDKVAVISYDENGEILNQNEITGDDLEEDQNGIIGAFIKEDDAVKWDVIITLDSKEYKFENMMDEENIYDMSVIPFDVEGDNLVLLEEVDE